MGAGGLARRDTPARRWGALLAALAVAALTARLGLWQMHRGEEKRALQAEMTERAQAPVLAAAALARTALAAQGQGYRRVQAQGHWVPVAPVFLDNRQMDGRPGFFVLSPLDLGHGAVVLVQRGWVPRDVQDRSRLPALPLPGGPVTLPARVAPWPSALTALGADAPGPIRQNVTPEALEALWHVRLLPYSLQQLAATPALTVGPEAAAEQTLQRRWPLPALDVRKHDLYAVQWFLFSLLTVGLYVWFQLIRPRLARPIA